MIAITNEKVSLPVAAEVQAAVKAQRDLAAFLTTKFETQEIQISDQDGQTHKVELPTSALCMLQDILAELADGNAVRVVPVHAELTTQEAADLLNVSRPHLVKLLEDGVLKFHKIGTHRRIMFSDLKAYKDARDLESTKAMADLAALSQELNMGY